MPILPNPFFWYIKMILFFFVCCLAPTSQISSIIFSFVLPWFGGNQVYFLKNRDQFLEQFNLKNSRLRFVKLLYYGFWIKFSYFSYIFKHWNSSNICFVVGSCFSCLILEFQKLHFVYILSYRLFFWNF